MVRREQLELMLMGLRDGNYATVSQARADAQNVFQSYNSVRYGINALTGEPVREEDSPGNYLLQQTNNELELVTFDADGRPDVSDLSPLQPGVDLRKK